MKFIAPIGFAIGALFYAIEVIGRMRGYIGFEPGATDAIAVLLLAGVAALIWGKRGQDGAPE